MTGQQFLGEAQDYLSNVMDSIGLDYVFLTVP
jgi:hypothetical protein